MSLESHMLAQMQTRPTTKRWVVAYSGGLDSSVLLHLSHIANQQLSKPKQICALHVNHQLSDHADAWQIHCQQQAASLSVPFFSEKVTINLSGAGIEAAARAVRYNVFEDFLETGDYLLMAHHSDDQAETMLLRLLRGSGVLGLASMPESRPLGQGELFRPLLQRARTELENYAKQNKLLWIEDESNDSLDFDRNFLRHQVIPDIEKRWPSAKKQLSSTAEHFQKAQSILIELAAQDLQNLNLQAERHGVSIDWRELKLLSEERRNNLIRYWCDCHKFSLPDAQQLQQIQQQFFSQNAMLTSAVVQWGDCQLRQFNQRLYLMPLLAVFENQEARFLWNIDEPLSLDGVGKLAIKKIADKEKSGIDPQKISGEAFQIRWRQGGERCTPVGRSSSQTVKKLLQEYKLETWLRDRVPLIYDNNELVAVGDLWVCEGFAAENANTGVQINWQPV
jgi:tRNA(Ile)-lysidine synthase